MALRSLIGTTLDRLPYVGRLRAQVRAQGHFLPGHFYSPIPAEADIRARLQQPDCADLPGIDLNIAAQRALLATFRAGYHDLLFPPARTAGTRYYFDQRMFCYVDAFALSAMLRHLRPQRIIEVGSGFSSAVMLDTIDRFFSEPPDLTLIEPDPARLRDVLRPDDFTRLALIEDLVQHVPLEHFMHLQAGDLLFIDSSHVLKCGSDVQFLLFDVLPRLPVGVVVHFHDIFAGFEYPARWLLDEGRYWNECYALRAFLSYNRAWEVLFFISHLMHVCHDWFESDMPLCLKHPGTSCYPGGSLYLQRRAL
jgi:Methyltransferase domain